MSQDDLHAAIQTILLNTKDSDNLTREHAVLKLKMIHETLALFAVPSVALSEDTVDSDDLGRNLDEEWWR